MGHAGDGSGIDGNSCEGLVLGNTGHVRSEPLVTVDKLKSTFMFGVPIIDASGNTPTDAFYQNNIDTAVSFFEHLLDISITPVVGHIEYKDYYQNDYWESGSMILSNYPLIQVRDLQLVYFRDDSGTPISVLKIPKSWLLVQRQDGLLRMRPSGAFPAGLQVNSNGVFYPELLRSQSLAAAWQITYDYGFEKIPTLLNTAIGLYATVLCLIPAGHLALGQAGLAGTSISLDGLSQSISTTASAENSAFSSTIKDYGTRLFGQNSNDPNSMINILKDYYKGSNLSLV